MSPRRLATLRLCAVLLLFGSAMTSLWLGLTTSPAIVRITSWYIGAIVLAIVGIIVLKLPISKEE